MMTTLELELARSAAKSVTRNPQNIKSCWFGFWNTALFQIASQVHRVYCNLYPRYSLGRAWTANDEDRSTITIRAQMEEDDNEYVAVRSDDETVNIKTRSRITDFALSLLVPSEDGNESLPIQESVAALVAIKRGAHRKWTGEPEQLKKFQKSLLLAAQETVFMQALYLFANDQWSHQDRVLVIAATADMWTYSIVSRAAYTPSNDNDGEDPEWEPKTEQFVALEWTEPAIWGSSEESGQMEDRVVKWIKQNFLAELE